MGILARFFDSFSGRAVYAHLMGVSGIPVNPLKYIVFCAKKLMQRWFGIAIVWA
jgi:hypothetical protein